MAEKMVFLTSGEKYYVEKIIEYKYYSGFAVSQKQKSIRSLHSAIKEHHLYSLLYIRKEYFFFQSPSLYDLLPKKPSIAL